MSNAISFAIGAVLGGFLVYYVLKGTIKELESELGTYIKAEAKKYL